MIWVLLDRFRWINNARDIDGGQRFALLGFPKGLANQDSVHPILCFPTTSEQQVRNLIEADPYWVNNIWTEYQIKEWIQAI